MRTSPAKRFISASEFKARCLELMDEVSASRSELVITKHGAAVARLVPMADGGASALGFLRGTVRNELTLFDSELLVGTSVATRQSSQALSPSKSKSVKTGTTRNK